MASTVCHESISNLEKLNKEKIRGLLIPPPPMGAKCSFLVAAGFCFVLFFSPQIGCLLVVSRCATPLRNFWFMLVERKDFF